MEHSFNIDIAVKYGVLEAILLKNIYYWIEKNKANKKHFYDGYYWTYNSTKAYGLLFPYYSERQIMNALNNLANKYLILKANYNAIKYDRTLWYALSENAISILQNCKMETQKKENGDCINVEPIPNINTYNKPNINTYINKEKNVLKKEKNDIEIIETNKKLIPPTLEEIKAYAIERNSIDLAQNFFDYFSEGNWTDAKGNKVLNWKQKFITWQKYNTGGKNEENGQNSKLGDGSKYAEFV